MATITINNLDPTAKARLHILAAAHGRSPEEEGGAILNATLLESNSPAPDEPDLLDVIRARVAKYGGFDVELPKRDATHDPIEFEK